MLGFLKWIYVGAGALAAFALFSLYDGMIDDPLVRREALSGYVIRSERDSLASQLAEEERRRNKAAQALEEHRKRLSASQKAEKELSDRLDQETAENERLLEAAGRAWRLDRADVDFILRNPRRQTE